MRTETRGKTAGMEQTDEFQVVVRRDQAISEDERSRRLDACYRLLLDLSMQDAAVAGEPPGSPGSEEGNDSDLPEGTEDD
jgi:hypothetical protein